MKKQSCKKADLVKKAPLPDEWIKQRCFFLGQLSAGCSGVIQPKGFIKNFQQFYILFGHHHAVTANGIEQDTQPGFGGIIPDSFDLVGIEIVHQFP